MTTPTACDRNRRPARQRLPTSLPELQSPLTPAGFLCVTFTAPTPRNEPTPRAPPAPSLWPSVSSVALCSNPSSALRNEPARRHLAQTPNSHHKSSQPVTLSEIADSTP